MKTKILLTIVLALSLSASNAQVKPFRFGVKASPVLAWMSPDAEGFENDGTYFGFSWGFMADITLTENYFIKTGFNMDYLGGKLRYTSMEDVSGTGDPVTGTLYRKYKLRYLQIPVTLKMKTNKFGNVAYFGEIGFGGSMNLKAKATDEFNYSGQTTPAYETDIKDDINFMKASLIVGAGLEYYLDESTSLLFSLNFNNGLTDILKGETNTDPPVKEKAVLYYFQLNVGVLF